MFCFDSVQYNGIIRLYTDYQGCLELSEHLEFRLSQAQEAYELLDDQHHSCIVNYEKTNDAYGEKIVEYNQLFYKTEKFRRQRNRSIITGSVVAVILTTVIILL